MQSPNVIDESVCGSALTVLGKTSGAEHSLLSTVDQRQVLNTLALSTKRVVVAPLNDKLNVPVREANGMSHTVQKRDVTKKIVFVLLFL